MVLIGLIMLFVRSSRGHGGPYRVNDYCSVLQTRWLCCYLRYISDLKNKFTTSEKQKLKRFARGDKNAREQEFKAHATWLLLLCTICSVVRPSVGFDIQPNHTFLVEIRANVGWI